MILNYVVKKIKHLINRIKNIPFRQKIHTENDTDSSIFDITYDNIEINRSILTPSNENQSQIESIRMDNHSYLTHNTEFFSDTPSYVDDLDFYQVNENHLCNEEMSRLELDGLVLFDYDIHLFKNTVDTDYILNQKNDLISPKKINKNLSTDECCICLESLKYKKTVILNNCEHVIHFKCIKNWLKQNSVKECPLCRSDQTRLYRRFIQ